MSTPALVFLSIVHTLCAISTLAVGSAPAMFWCGFATASLAFCIAQIYENSKRIKERSREHGRVVE